MKRNDFMKLPVVRRCSLEQLKDAVMYAVKDMKFATKNGECCVSAQCCVITDMLCCDISAKTAAKFYLDIERADEIDLSKLNMQKVYRKMLKYLDHIFRDRPLED